MQSIINSSVINRTRRRMTTALEIAKVFNVPIDLADLFLEVGTVQTVQVGDFLGVRGQEPTHFALVMDGVFGVERVDHDGVNRLVGLLGSGSSIFENPIVMANKVNTVIQSWSKARVVLVPAAIIKSLLDENLELNKLLVRTQAKKTMYFAQLLYWSHEKDMDRKVHLALTLLGDTVNSSTLTLSNEQLSTILGMSRNSVSRSLKALTEAGSIEVEKGAITVLEELRDPVE